MATTLVKVTPEFLASVCQRWMTVIYGKIGAKLWCTVDINITDSAVPVGLMQRALRFIERSRSSPLTLFLRGADIDTSEAALLEAVMRSSAPSGISVVLLAGSKSFGFLKTSQATKARKSPKVPEIPKSDTVDRHEIFGVRLIKEYR